MAEEAPMSTGRAPYRSYTGEPPYTGQPSVTVYEHANYLGRRATYFGNVPRMPNFGVSSLKITNGAAVTLFYERNYSGVTETFIKDTPNLSGSRVGNDTASSLKLFRGGSWVILYEHINYMGRNQVFEGDMADLEHTRIGSRSISSLRISNAAVTLYSEPFFGGFSESFDRDVPDMKQTKIGQDSCSSIRLNPLSAARSTPRQPPPGGFNIARGSPVWARKVVGVPAAVTDGHVFPPGTDPQIQPSAQLVDESASLTIDLGWVQSIRRVSLWADANDEYVLFFSPDGQHWSKEIICPRLPGYGFRPRDVFITTEARYLKIQGRSGDGFYSVAEVEVFGP